MDINDISDIDLITEIDEKRWNISSYIIGTIERRKFIKIFNASSIGMQMKIKNTFSKIIMNFSENAESQKQIIGHFIEMIGLVNNKTINEIDETILLFQEIDAEVIRLMKIVWNYGDDFGKAFINKISDTQDMELRYFEKAISLGVIRKSTKDIGTMSFTGESYYLTHKGFKMLYIFSDSFNNLLIGKTIKYNPCVKFEDMEKRPFNFTELKIDLYEILGVLQRTKGIYKNGYVHRIDKKTIVKKDNAAQWVIEKLSKISYKYNVEENAILYLYSYDSAFNGFDYFWYLLKYSIKGLIKIEERCFFEINDEREKFMNEINNHLVEFISFKESKDKMANRRDEWYYWKN